MLSIALYDLPPCRSCSARSASLGLLHRPDDAVARHDRALGDAAGEFGKVFGFVTTGFNVGGMFAPLVFGALLDYGHPSGVFLLASVCCVIGIVTVMTISGPREAS